MATSYRSSHHATCDINSSDEGVVNSSKSSDSDATDSLWSKKRSKLNVDESNKIGIFPMPNNIRQTLPFRRLRQSKNANIWGSVLTEQSSDDISSSLGAVGMQRHIARGPESFDLPSDVGDQREGLYSGSSDQSDTEQVDVKEQQSAKKKSKSKRKRKKPQNRNVPEFKPGQEVVLNRRCELSDTDPVDKVAEEVAFRLWERKKDLIRTLTETLGVHKTIDFCNKTEDIERNGGLMTMQGIRRRTPGGTFLHLIRNDPHSDQEAIKRVFALDAERERMRWEQRKIAKKGSKREQTDCETVNFENDGKQKQPNDNGSAERTHFVDFSSRLPEKDKELSEGEIMSSDDNNAEGHG